LYSLDTVLEGNMDPLVDALLQDERAKKLAEGNASK
jgi:protein subunit release factor A